MKCNWAYEKCVVKADKKGENCGSEKKEEVEADGAEASSPPDAGADAGAGADADAGAGAGAGAKVAGAPSAEPDIVPVVTDDTMKAGATVEEMTTNCEKRNGTACYQAGLHYGIGRNVLKRDPRKATEFFVRACKLGHDWACANSDAANEAGEVAYWREACWAGMHRYCARLAFATMNGRGAKKNVPYAAKLFEKLCNARDSVDAVSRKSCFNLGLIYVNRDGVSRDGAKAFRLFERACNAGEMAGCNSVGVMYKEGDGVKVDLARAAAFHKKSCDGGYARGCRNLAYLVENGMGVPQDKANAISLNRRACELGEQDACDVARERQTAKPPESR